MANRRAKRKIKLKRLQNHKNRRKSLKHNYNLASAKKHIKNFSDVTLSDDEYLILGKGLKFIPTPSTDRLRTNILRDFNGLCRKMRCKFELDNGNYKPLHPFYVKSVYTPQFANNAIETYIFQTKMEIDNLKFSTHYSNLSKNEWNALKSLRKRADIVIKKADKNNNIVILKSDTYISQGLMHIDSIQKVIRKN